MLVPLVDGNVETDPFRVDLFVTRVRQMVSAENIHRLPLFQRNGLFVIVSRAGDKTEEEHRQADVSNCSSGEAGIAFVNTNADNDVYKECKSRGKGKQDDGEIMHPESDEHPGEHDG